MKINSYKEALEYIHSVSWRGSRPGLERISELCKRLGNPEKSLRIIHVAGTNGKGSVCAMIASILNEAGYRVGLYTSPYLIDFCERMKIDGKPISPSRLCSVTEKVSDAAEKMPDMPTEFELITAIAFQYYYEEQPDFVVLEVGMGGRLDATNVIENPALSVITSISLDHTDYLGNTVSEIAKEKAGIIKPHCPTVCAEVKNEAHTVIAETAKKMNSDIFYPDFGSVSDISFSENGITFSFGDTGVISLPLLGEYQIKNAVTAITAVRILGVNDTEKIKRGFSYVVWPGRLEIYSTDPLIILDCSHNPDGIEKTIVTLKKTFPEKSFAVIFGMMADKDYITAAALIAAFSKAVFTITPDNKRALSSDRLAKEVIKAGKDAQAFERTEDAVNAAFATDCDAILTIGSFYSYAALRKEIEKHFDNQSK